MAAAFLGCWVFFAPVPLAGGWVPEDIKYFLHYSKNKTHN